MRIERVEAIPIDIPLTKTFSGSGYHVANRCTVVTRIHTSGGLVSEVYNGDNRAEGGALAKIVMDELAPRIVGEEVFAYERLWEKMFPITVPLRDRALAMQAIACVDTAVWDLIGKALGVNVCRLLGGYRDSLEIIAIGGYYIEGRSLASYAEEMDGLRAAGMAGCKFKVGGLSPEADLERVKAARDGGGPGFVLMVDANRGWSTADAIRFARLIEPYDIRWFEEPCHWQDDARSMAAVRRASPIPVAAGQSEISHHAVRRLLEADAVDVVNFDASEGGGVTEWKRAAALCAGIDVQLGHHEEPQIASHLLASVPNGTYLECFSDPARDPVWERMILNRPNPKDGVIAVPQGPGFGLELDWTMIEKHRIG
jgi:D-galactarolactone cycloisomerase